MQTRKNRRHRRKTRRQRGGDKLKNMLSRFSNKAEPDIKKQIEEYIQKYNKTGTHNEKEVYNLMTLYTEGMLRANTRMNPKIKMDLLKYLADFIATGKENLKTKTAIYKELDENIAKRKEINKKVQETKNLFESVSKALPTNTRKTTAELRKILEELGLNH